MNKKIITIIFTLSTMLFLVGCSFTNNESNGSDKNYTYNDLDENQKEIIDNVYAELGDWGYTYEPSAIPGLSEFFPVAFLLNRYPRPMFSQFQNLS